MTITGHDSLKTRRTLTVEGQTYDYFALAAAEPLTGNLSRLPFSLKILLENLLRFEDDASVSQQDIAAIGLWLREQSSHHEIAYHPARVLVQDFTGVPAVADLAAMREAMQALGGDPARINPLTPVDLVIDHSVMVDHFGNSDAFRRNMDLEFDRNQERYEFLRWGQTAFSNFRVVPPGTGICHQVNMEYLAQCVWTSKDWKSGRQIAYPDTVVGTDSHTTMINGLGVLGWGVGGIEAEAAMLGQPVSMLIPDVIGVRLSGALAEGVTATDLVLTVVELLRRKGVVGKFVEFTGPGLAQLTLADRATIANMAPEYGATCGVFPIDQVTLDYLTFTGRDPHRVRLVEAYARAQGLWRDADATEEPLFTDVVALDLSTVTASLAGPKRPQDRVPLPSAPRSFYAAAAANGGGARRHPVQCADYDLQDGAVVIAAITSCTNTSNPAAMVAAGLVARKARTRGLRTQPWVKTSLAPGSQVVTDYLRAAGLQEDLDALGFALVGYGCTTCIGNSGPLPEPLAAAIVDGDLTVAAVLSGNRNFEGRVSPHTRCNYLASPALVVAYALAGTMTADLTHDPLGVGADGAPVFLKDVWPSNQEIAAAITQALTPAMFVERYRNVFDGPEAWQAIPAQNGQTFAWKADSTYIQRPPFFVGATADPEPVTGLHNARALLILGDSVTTDHISPAGSFGPKTPAGRYLSERGVEAVDFNSYGARRGNHEVMMRGTFANIRIRNRIAPGTEGGVTRYISKTGVASDPMSVYDAAMRYHDDSVPLVVIGGKEYGTGSSRDWAAKGAALLGVRAVIAQSFERIHRSNLVGMGILPLQFENGIDAKSLGLDGTELFEVLLPEDGFAPGLTLALRIVRADGRREETPVSCRIDTMEEAGYYRHGGILRAVLRRMMQRT